MKKQKSANLAFARQVASLVQHMRDMFCREQLDEKWI